MLSEKKTRGLPRQYVQIDGECTAETGEWRDARGTGEHSIRFAGFHGSDGRLRDAVADAE